MCDSARKAEIFLSTVRVASTSYLEVSPSSSRMLSNEKNVSATVTVLGCSGVGKTALVVRYLTKRYIGDYISGTDITYKCELNFMRRQVEVKIVDTSGETSKDRILEIAKTRRSENDVIMLVYSLNDVSSFHFVTDLIHEIAEVAPRASLLVVGNKSDLDQSSDYFDAEMKRFANRRCLAHVTVSAKSSCLDATRIFTKSISSVMKRGMLETSVSSHDLTTHHEENHEFKFPPGSRRRRSGGPEAKLARRATLDSGLVLQPNERRHSDRTPSVDFTIIEEIEEKGEINNVSLTQNSISNPNPKSLSFRKRKKIPPTTIPLAPPSPENETVFEKEYGPPPPRSAPLPNNGFPVFRFPEVSCAAEFRYASLPTSPSSLLKRQNSFLNKLKGALTAVPQRLRSPK